MSILGNLDSHGKAKMRRIALAGYTQELPPKVKLVTPEAMQQLTMVETDKCVDDEKWEQEWWASRQGRLERVPEIAAPFVSEAASSSHR